MKINKAHCLVCKCKQDHNCWINILGRGLVVLLKINSGWCTHHNLMRSILQLYVSKVVCVCNQNIWMKHCAQYLAIE